jgi:hypothetical protein
LGETDRRKRKERRKGVKKEIKEPDEGNAPEDAHRTEECR